MREERDNAKKLLAQIEWSQIPPPHKAMAEGGREMSKCREAFEQHFAGFDLTREKLGNELAPFYYVFQTQEAWEDWQAAWNAATQNAVVILHEANADGTDPAYWAEAIEQEKEE